MFESTLPLPGLSPVCGKKLEVKFDGGQLSSDGGILVLRAVEQQLCVADRLAGCLVDPRARSDHPQPGRHHPLSVDDDCGRVRRR
jgi:hypothetical protein